MILLSRPLFQWFWYFSAGYGKNGRQPPPAEAALPNVMPLYVTKSLGVKMLSAFADTVNAPDSGEITMMTGQTAIGQYVPRTSVETLS
ncbi:MAG: hypothetical protein IKE57_06905 [Oscillospiraceae bacterium]|nr:hypothetical protein [Oscillospiraceae bacterium]